MRKTAREKILEAAFKTFTELGYSGTTTQNIAKEACVNEVTIFRLFGNKQSLFSAVLEEFIILKSIQSLDENKLLEKHSKDTEGFFMELGILSFNYFKETFPFMKMQMMESASGKLDHETMERIAQIPLGARLKLTTIFEKCAAKGWIKQYKNYDPLLVSFYGPFMAYLMNKSNFGDRIFKEPDEFMIKEIVKNFLNGCLK